MSAKTDFVQSIIKDLPSTYSNSLPVRGALMLLAEAIFDANGSMTPQDLSVTNAKLANVATKTFKARKTAGNGSPEDITAQEARAILASGKVEVVTDNKAIAVADSGKVFVVTADAKVMSLPVGADGLEYTFKNGGANGAVLLAIDPNGTEVVVGNGLTSGAGKQLLNTKATAKQGDSVKVTWVTGIGWFAETIGTWASEA